MKRALHTLDAETKSKQPKTTGASLTDLRKMQGQESAAIQITLTDPQFFGEGLNRFVDFQVDFEVI